MERFKKNKLYQLLLLLFLLLSLSSCAQSKSVIRKQYAFYTEHLPGNIRADENGNELPFKPDTVIVVYLETTTKSITLDTAWKNGACYKITAQLINLLPFEIGTAINANKKIVLGVAKGNFLWQLYLQPLNKALPNQQIIKGNEILIKGKYKGKKITRKIASPIQLVAIPSV